MLGADQKEATKEKTRDRQWDRKNPAFSFRIRPEDAQRMKDTARGLGVPKDALARALMQAAFDAVDEGRLALSVQEERRDIVDKIGRERTFIRKNVLTSWQKNRIDENAP
jgi:predicted DNA-binding protein